MQSSPFWPCVLMTQRQNKKFDAAFELAVSQAGSIGRLAPRLSSHSGEYISHQALRNWRSDRRIPPQWALVMEDYTNGKANFFDLVPWLLPRAVQYHTMIEDQQKKAS